MIFLTVGAQMPFDRLVSAVDKWIGQTGTVGAFAQIGSTTLRPRHMAFSQFVEPAEFRYRVSQASAIVAHAGMGSILTALELGKPILVMPRRGELRETRNDHQLATARQLEAQRRVMVAYDERELMQKLDQLHALRASQVIRPYASEELLSTIRGFIFSAAAPQDS